ncbi:MAG: glycosyltransferase family 39 protein, partial [Gemmatimonadota bacterium]
MLPGRSPLPGTRSGTSGWGPTCCRRIAGTCRPRPAIPPLAYYLHDLPTFLFPIDWSAWRAGGAVADLEALQSADVGRGNALLLDPHYDGELLLLAWRASSLVLAALLALVLYRWGSRLGGARGGLAALFFMALSPNLLAHAPLVTTDFAVCALFATAVYALRSLLLAPSGPRAVAAGLAAAGAALAKLSGILIVPLGALLAAASLAAPALETRDVFGAGSARSGWRRRPWAALAGPGAIAAAAAAAAIWVAYGMDPRPYLDVFRSQLHDLGGG